MDNHHSAVESFSIVRNDALFRLQRAIGLIPAEGSGILRRAIIYSLFCWIPLVIWAYATGRLMPNDDPESLAGHYGIHIRCLVAIPLLIIAEAGAQAILPVCLAQFLRTGLIDENLEPAFREIIADGIRLRDRIFPWVVITGLIITWTVSIALSPNKEEVSWAGLEVNGHGFGSWWFLLVIRPIFNILLLAWLWRLILTSIVLFRIARLPLKLVPAHPDGVGGLGFVQRIPIIFSPMAFAVSAVIASSWAHNVMYHEVSVPSLYIQMGMLVAILVILILLPLLSFSPLLAKTKKRAAREYGALLAEHGRLVHERWIQGKEVADRPLLDAPELGPSADIQTLYQSANAMRPLVINKLTLLMVVVPTAIPMLIVVATQWPLRSTLGKLLMALL
nr:hypothetical protein [Janthinobacterium sp. Marseille]